MGKISVKHYFNNRLKSESIKGEIYNPLYVQIVRSTRTHQIRSVFVTEKITEKQLQSAEIQELCRQETDFILSFFEFAESAVNDFVVSNSKTDLGKLLNFYNTEVWETLCKYGFIDGTTRKSINLKIVEYFEKNSNLKFDTIAKLVKDFLNDFENIYLFKNEIADLYKEKILTYTEAGKLEFICLLLDYNSKVFFNSETLKFDDKLSLFQWNKNKSEIVTYIKRRAKYSRESEILQYAAETDTLLKNIFSDFYNSGFYVEKLFESEYTAKDGKKIKSSTSTIH
jgi:hypothetical protein